jgi:predicted RNA binding protein YcfA (HicA-like mRNA interferase family)
VTKLEKLIRKLMTGRIPVFLRPNDIIALYEEMGWTFERQGSTHWMFTKPGERTQVVVVRNSVPDPGAVGDLVRLLRREKAKT